MGRKARPNDPCPCKSGIKFKKCCGRPAGSPKPAGMVHTPAERGSAFEKLDFFIDELWEEEEEAAFDEFWARHLDREGELPPDLLALSRGVQETWFAFDYRLEDDSRIIDHFLEQAELTPGERSYLSALRCSSMRLYEVTDTVPGTSMTLRDIVEGTVVTVNERMGSRQVGYSRSRSITRHTCLAARVIPRGCSGGPEIEMALLHIPNLVRESVLAALKQHREEFFRDDPSGSLDDFYKELPPFFHGDGFFCSKVMSDYSKAVLIEGDCPVEYVDLEVFVAPPLPAGSSLLRRTNRRTPAVAASALEEILLAVGGRSASAAFGGSRAREAMGGAAAIYGESFGAKGAAHAGWELAPTHQGLERAGLVVVNVRARDDRDAAEPMLEEIARIRSDDAVRAAVLGRFAHRTKVTAVVADLSDPKDSGTKKALTRIKRALAQRGRP